MKKILDPTKIKKVLEKKYKKSRVGMCHGVFDLLHIGHIKHFEEAKKISDILIVSVTADEFVNKGPNRPAFSENLRMESLAALSCVDFVCLSDSATAIKNLKIIKPNFYIKGIEYKEIKNDLTGEIYNEIKAVKKMRSKIVYTKGITSSSSKIINQFLQNQTESQKIFLDRIKKLYSFKDIKHEIENFKKNTALVLGETIIDEYNFTEAIGKSGKEPNLVLRDLNSEQFIGGAAAIATNLAQFCKKVFFLTMIGNNSEYLKDIKKKLPKNVKLIFIKKRGSPTIIKKRYLDSISKNKLFGIYKINDEYLKYDQEKLLIKKYEKYEKKSDMIVVSDYGHGFITKKLSQKITNSKKFVALNAQINANNIGYHSLVNYKKINCVIINERELRHEMRDRTNDIKKLSIKFAYNQKVSDLIVTRGSEGAILYSSAQKKFFSCPPFAHKIIDKIGSGDSMLALSSIALKVSKNKKLSLLIGSLAAAESIKNFGNKKTIDRESLLKSISHILK